MSIKSFFISVFILLITCLRGQTLLKIMVQDASANPIPGVTMTNSSKSGLQVSSASGEIQWKPDHLPDTVELRHLSFLPKTLIVPKSIVSPMIVQLTSAIQMLENAVINANWATPGSIITHTTLDRQSIDQKNFGQDIPYLLQSLPSTVSSSDAGNGIGYTGMRIRGLDPTQTNVLINGVPLNDAESQGVFWVDLPDLAASASEIQVQRGIGLSGSGQVAFGSSVLINTNRFSPNPYLTLESTIGSFNTKKEGIQLGTGNLNHNFNIQGRLSRIGSDGYIDRADSKLWSGGISISQISSNRSFRLHLFDGHERTYQAWYGAPVQYVLAGNSRYNPAGTEKSGMPYENQVDDYRQTHLQFLYLEQLSNKWTLQNTFHFTPGYGYYEEYKAGQIPSEYHLAGVDPVDLVRRRYLSNQFYGSIHYLQYKQGYNDLQIGTSWNHYAGRHFGRVVRLGNIPVQDPLSYYDQNASKWSGMAFTKAELGTDRWSGLADIQARYIHYSYIPEGHFDQNQLIATHLFLSPKLGFKFDTKRHLQVFGFAGLAYREPNREDYTKADNSLPKSEQLIDYELGLRWNKKSFTLEQNLYYMDYKNQLVPTGKLNDVGAYIRSNVPRSYRLGLETSWSLQLAERLLISGNLNLSDNRTRKLIEYIDDWDSGGQLPKTHQKRPIAFSPHQVINVNATVHLLSTEPNTSKNALDWETSFQSIGSQYLDGTGSEYSKMDGYHLLHSNIMYHQTKNGKALFDIRARVNNIFNTFYTANGWIYRFNSPSYNPTQDDPYAEAEDVPGQYHQKGLYPQAGRNFLISLRVYIHPKE